MGLTPLLGISQNSEALMIIGNSPLFDFIN
jgi:hypothetical protein